MAVVYRHTRLDTNEVFYIGIGNEKKRAYVKNRRNKFWRNIIKNTPYKVDIIFEDISYKEAKEAEILLINLYGRRDLNKGTLVNHTDGGDGTLGFIGWNTGKTLSEETKRRISETKTGVSVNKGMKRSEEQKRNHSVFMTGRTQSAETKAKRILAMKGIVNTKKIIDTSTGIIYNSITEASNALGVKRTTLNAQLLGVSHTPTTLKYY